MKDGILIFIGLLFSGCAAMDAQRLTQAAPMDIKSYQEQMLVKVNAPDWVLKGNGVFKDKAFYGVGAAAGVQDPAVRREAADDRARNDLVKLLALNTSSVMKDYQSVTASGDSKAYGEELRLEGIVQTLTHATLAGIVIIDHWEHPTRNELYALARLDIEKFEQAIGRVAELNEKVRKAINVRTEKLRQELDDRIRGQEEKLFLLDNRISEQSRKIQEQESVTGKNNGRIEGIKTEQPENLQPFLARVFETVRPAVEYAIVGATIALAIAGH